MRNYEKKLTTCKISNNNKQISLKKSYSFIVYYLYMYLYRNIYNKQYQMPTINNIKISMYI